MNAKLKPILTYRLSGAAESPTLTVLKTRDLLDVSDEPTARGGTNEGFAPTEFMLGALAACTNVISHKIARRNGIEITALEVSLEAKFNQLGVNLVEDVQVPFPEIKMTVDVTTAASEAEIEELANDLRKYCAISRIIRESGTNIIEVWNVVQA